MTEQDIRELLENLGSKVSILAEENRVCNNHDEAGRKLIKLLEEYITEEDVCVCGHTNELHNDKCSKCECKEFELDDG